MRQGSREAFAGRRIKGAIPGDLKFRRLKATACCNPAARAGFQRNPEPASFYCSPRSLKNSDTRTSCLAQALAAGNGSILSARIVMGEQLDVQGSGRQAD